MRVYIITGLDQGQRIQFSLLPSTNNTRQAFDGELRDYKGLIALNLHESVCKARWISPQGFHAVNLQQTLV